MHTQREGSHSVSWFKVDDGFAFHSKTLAAGNAAVGMWVRAGSWSSQQLTDGMVPLSIARQLGPKSQTNSLVEAGLWVPAGGGFEFHQWSTGGRNPTRAQVEAKRVKDAERLRRWREDQDKKRG
jgi:hypothetical protein